MADAWNGSFGTAWGPSWGDGVTTTTQPGGGIYYQGGRKRKHVKRITENVREWIDGVYADLTAPSAPVEVRKQAAAIVKPHAETKKAIPQVSQVDWSGVAQEARKVRALLDLYAEVDADYRAFRARVEDEDAVLTGLFL